MTIVAGVDSSTQSCTVTLHEASSGVLLASASAPHPRTGSPSSEQNPEDWWGALVVAFARACELAGCAPAHVRGISIAAQYHGLVALDSADRVIRPAKLWNDTTSAPQAAALLAALPAERWVTRAGSVPTAAFTVTKLAWLAENEPENFAAMSSALLPHDWITFQLTGRKVTDRVDASGTGYFDPTTNEWCEDILSLVSPERDWLSSLPTVLGPDELAGHADTARAAELGLRPDTVVACGTGDQAACGLALGVTEGDVVVSLGTSGTVYGQSRRAHPDARGVVNGTANATGGFQPVVVTLNAAKVTDTFARLMGVDHAELSALALAADPGETDRPTLAAFLDGERSPDRPTARGLLAGISSTTTREQLARSAFEGVVLGLEFGFSCLRGVGVPTSGRILLTGGAAKSPAYQRIMASIFDRPIHLSTGDGSLDSARGAAIQAAAVLAGETVAATSAAWAPATVIVAEPLDSERGAARRAGERYRRVAAVDIDSLAASS